jgi:hypothetical protein
MRKLVAYALASGLSLLAAAAFADSTPAPAPAPRVAIPSSSSQLPRITVLPRTRVAPLSASALAAAKLQLVKAYPQAATTTPPAPLTLDVSHWQASSGALSGTLTIASVVGIGFADPSLPPMWQSDSGGGAILTLGGLQANALYLLDFAAMANDGSSLDVRVCWNSFPMNCMGTNLAGGSMTFSGGHAIFGFMAQQSAATLFVSGIPSGTLASGFTLHPAS